MKKTFTLLFIVSLSLLFSAKSASAQELKFGHVNLQEVIFLMPEMDSAQVILEKYSKELEEIFTGMQNEFSTKYNNYQQMSANWTPAVVEAKTKELQEMQNNLQQFEQNAQREIQVKQQEILAPIYVKASDALKKLAKSNGFTYIFDISSNNIPYINEEVSINIADMLKGALNIPLDKKLQQRAPQGGEMAN